MLAVIVALCSMDTVLAMEVKDFQQTDPPLKKEKEKEGKQQLPPQQHTIDILALWCQSGQKISPQQRQPQLPPQQHPIDVIADRFLEQKEELLQAKMEQQKELHQLQQRLQQQQKQHQSPQQQKELHQLQQLLLQQQIQLVKLEKLEELQKLSPEQLLQLQPQLQPQHTIDIVAALYLQQQQKLRELRESQQYLIKLSPPQLQELPVKTLQQMQYDYNEGHQELQRVLRNLPQQLLPAQLQQLQQQDQELKHEGQKLLGLLQQLLRLKQAKMEQRQLQQQSQQTQPPTNKHE